MAIILTIYGVLISVLVSLRSYLTKLQSVLIAEYTVVSKPCWEHIELPSKSSSKTPQKPHRRSGHVCVAHKGQLIM